MIYYLYLHISWVEFNQDAAVCQLKWPSRATSTEYLQN